MVFVFKCHMKMASLHLEHCISGDADISNIVPKERTSLHVGGGAVVLVSIKAGRGRMCWPDVRAFNKVGALSGVLA